jgi:uncharacterized protein YjiS (DUF1127 family)
LSSICVKRRPDRRRPSLAASALFRNVRALARIWRERRRLRRRLAAMSEREWQDMEACWSEIAREAGKPFSRE